MRVGVGMTKGRLRERVSVWVRAKVTTDPVRKLEEVGPGLGSWACRRREEVREPIPRPYSPEPYTLPCAQQKFVTDIVRNGASA